MKSSQLNKSRFIVGIVLVVIAVLMFLSAKGDYSTAGAIGISVLGLISIAISRRRQIAHLGRPTRACSRPLRLAPLGSSAADVHR